MKNVLIIFCFTQNNEAFNFKEQNQIFIKETRKAYKLLCKIKGKKEIHSKEYQEILFSFNKAFDICRKILYMEKNENIDGLSVNLIVKIFKELNKRKYIKINNDFSIKFEEENLLLDNMKNEKFKLQVDQVFYIKSSSEEKSYNFYVTDYLNEERIEEEQISKDFYEVYLLKYIDDILQDKTLSIEELEEELKNEDSEMHQEIEKNYNIKFLVY